MFGGGIDETRCEQIAREISDKTSRDISERIARELNECNKKEIIKLVEEMIEIQRQYTSLTIRRIVKEPDYFQEFKETVSISMIVSLFVNIIMKFF